MTDLLSDPFISTWYSFINSKITSIDINMNSLTNCGETQLYHTIHQRIRDTELQTLVADLNLICSPRFYGLPPLSVTGVIYFISLINPLWHRAFMLARFNIFPSAVLSGKYRNIPFKNHQCKHCLAESESNLHILLHCPKYSDLCQLLLSSVISNFSGSP